MNRRLTILFLALSGLAAAPFLWLDNPPLQDYPNTLARALILTELDAPDTTYAEDFQASSLPVPNAATDILVPPLIPWLGIEGAGKAVILLSVLLLPLGALALFRVLSPDARHAPLAFWILPFAHNWFLAMGFLNFVLGLGLSLALLALWFRWSSGWTTVRLVLFTLSTLLLWTVHLFALASLGLAALCLTIAEKRSWKARGLDLLPFVPGAAVYLVLRLVEGLPHGLHVTWEGYEQKLRLLANTLVMFSWVEGVAVSVALVLAWALLRRGAGLRPERRGLALLIGFGAAYLVFPKMLLGTYFADDRLVPYLVVAALIAWPIPERRRRLGVVVAVGITVAALGLSTRHLVRLDREMTEELSFLEHMEPGCRVLPMEYRPEVGRVDVWHHTACWYTIRKGGTTAYQFAKRGEHLLRWKRTLRAPDEYWWWHGYPPPDVEMIARDFDYFWKIGSGLPTTEDLERRGVRRAVRGDAELWSLDG